MDALDRDGAVTGYVFESKGFSRIDIDTNESDPVYSVARQLKGLALKPLQGFGVLAASHGFAEKLLAWENDRAIARRRLAIAHRASTRPGRPADSSSPTSPLSTRSPPRPAPTWSPFDCVM